MIWILVALLFWPQVVTADIAFPTNTTIYFEQNGAPVNVPVDFSISCYGYSWAPGPDPMQAPGTYIPTEVYQFSAQCPSYGCSIDENYYMNYRHLDYCMLAATVNGKTVLTSIGNQPYTECNDDAKVTRSCVSRFDLTDTYQGKSVTNQSFWLAFVLTVVIETILLLIAFTFVLRRRFNWWLVGLSAITLPYVWFVIPNLPYAQVLPGWYTWNIYLAEFLVVIVEAGLLVWIAKISKRQAIVMSFVINLVSYLCGLAISFWMAL